MLRQYTAGPWAPKCINPMTDGFRSWEVNPPRIDAAKATIAMPCLSPTLTEEEVRANTRVMAAAPALAGSLTALLACPAIRGYLEVHERETLADALNAIEAAGVQL